MLRLGRARLTRFLIRYSRGAWRESHADAVLAAARDSIAAVGPGPDGIDFAELGADIAVEAEQAQVLTEEVEDLDERIANLYAETDPASIIATAPGVGPVPRASSPDGSATHTGSPASPRSAPTPGWFPRSTSPASAPVPGLTKAGDALLREALCAAADQARKIDPQLAAKYDRLIDADRHHDSALCHVATMLLTRIAACWRHGEHYHCATPTAAPSPTTKADASCANTTKSAAHNAAPGRQPTQPNDSRTGRAGSLRSR